MTVVLYNLQLGANDEVISFTGQLNGSVCVQSAVPHNQVVLINADILKLKAPVVRKQVCLLGCPSTSVPESLS